MFGSTLSSQLSKLRQGLIINQDTMIQFRETITSQTDRIKFFNDAMVSHESEWKSTIGEMTSSWMGLKEDFKGTRAKVTQMLKRLKIVEASLGLGEERDQGMTKDEMYEHFTAMSEKITSQGLEISALFSQVEALRKPAKSVKEAPNWEALSVTRLSKMPVGKIKKIRDLAHELFNMPYNVTSNIQREQIMQVYEDRDQSAQRLAVQGSTPTFTESFLGDIAKERARVPIRRLDYETLVDETALKTYYHNGVLVRSTLNYLHAPENHDEWVVYRRSLDNEEYTRYSSDRNPIRKIPGDVTAEEFIRHYIYDGEQVSATLNYLLSDENSDEWQAYNDQIMTV